MSFLDFLGECLGEMAAKAQQIQNYKNEYEQMKNNELEQEYQLLRNKSGEECRERLTTVCTLLNERYKREYEQMTDNALKREIQKLKNQPNEELRNRHFKVAREVLETRGYK